MLNIRRAYRSVCPLVLLIVLAGMSANGQSKSQKTPVLPGNIQLVGDAAKPWVFWYWMQGAYSKAAITADLEAMKSAGIAGAYLAPIKGKAEPPIYTPAIDQLSPQWWDMVKHALNEADRLGIKIAMLPNDGFATAGGPWITPELSMQKVVTSSLILKGGKLYQDTFPALPSYKGYARQIAVLAFPVSPKEGLSTESIVPKVTTSTGGDASFLVKKGNKQNFSSSEPCWIQYEFTRPFTCRSVVITVNNYNHQAQRLLIQVSDDGKNFRDAERLQPPRAGWLDWDADVTHEIRPVTARYFRFVYDKEGTEPGAEDLDAAKWKQSLKIAGIELSSSPRIHQFEGKTAEVWRVSKRTTSQQLPDSLCVPLANIVNISAYMGKNGVLRWKVPAGKWMILRVGYTSTGHMNETAGAGKGLECDKFNPDVVKLQFDKWFGEALRVAGPELAGRVLNTFHVDSWESGSQNWSPVFEEEFKKRRGYDPKPYLPAMAGIPVQSADVSERFLFDIRQTVSELITDNFFKTLKKLANEKGCIFTSETTGPVMAADGMLHFKETDVPMGEFWLRSPSHDKPTDIFDAISGAHVYGKPLIQAEAFTEVRMNWNEHPGNLKPLQDRNYAFGINKLVYHVYTHNPWFNRRPGMTLSDVGLLFQRDQTWWKPGRAWVEYADRCQSLLQQGTPVTDLAVFTGEELPRRAILPNRLVSSLPGIFGKEAVEKERRRQENRDLPMQEKPVGVNVSANMADPGDWTDPLHGYHYDSFNLDALLHLAKVNNGYIELPGGARYAILVLPGKHPMQPNTEWMSAALAERLLQLVKDGATVVLGDRPVATPGLKESEQNDQKLLKAVEELWGGTFTRITDASGIVEIKKIGQGKVVKGPYQAGSFVPLGLSPDFTFQARQGEAGKIAWNHRSSSDTDIYFVSNQDSVEKELSLSFRVSGKTPELYDPVSGRTLKAGSWSVNGGRTELPLRFAPNASWFVIFREQADVKPVANGKNWLEFREVEKLDGNWKVQFDPAFGGPKVPVEFKGLADWSKAADSLIRYYSGTAVYTRTFNWRKQNGNKRVWLNLGDVANIAEVKLNGVPCGVAWTAPYQVDITDAIRSGKNTLSIEVTNTWFNRMIGDQRLPEEKRITRTTATFRFTGYPLSKAGLLGPVSIKSEQ